MAIGSDPEIGAKFGTLKDFDWKKWREYVGDDLMGGYGKIGYPEKYRPQNVENVDTNHTTESRMQP
jgi:hypothetical protein